MAYFIITPAIEPVSDEPAKIVYWHDLATRDWVTQLQAEDGSILETVYNRTKRDALTDAAYYSQDNDTLPIERI